MICSYELEISGLHFFSSELIGEVIFRKGIFRNYIKLRRKNNFSLEKKTFWLKIIQLNYSDKYLAKYSKTVLILREKHPEITFFHSTYHFVEPSIETNNSFLILIKKKHSLNICTTFKWKIEPYTNNTFFATSGFGFFEGNKTITSIQIIVLDNIVPELKKSFVLSLESVDLFTVIKSNITLIKNESDYPGGVFIFEKSVIETRERHVQINVLRKYGLLVNVTLSVYQHERLLQTLLFFENEAKKSFIFYKNSKTTELKLKISERNKNLSQLPSSVIGFRNKMSINFLENLVFSEISIDNSFYIVEEGNSLEILINRKGKLDSVCHLRVIYKDISTEKLKDYLIIASNLMFKKGDSNIGLKIDIIDDNIPEQTEKFLINIRSASGIMKELV